MSEVAEKRERLFIGVPVPEATRAQLERQIPKNLPGRPSPPENWHFTLRFLGATDSSRKVRLIERLDAARFGAPFEIEFDILGAFPNARRARVVWVGVGNGHQRLQSVAVKAELAAVESGFEAEARKFSAHLTIARLKQPEQISHFLATARQVSASMQVSEVFLYRSEMGGSLSRYVIVERFPLG